MTLRIENRSAWVSSYMPTIQTLNGRRYFTYSNDHAPAHVHVTSANGNAKFELNCMTGPVVCVKARGYSDPELNVIRRELTNMIIDCCDHWRQTYGAFV